MFQPFCEIDENHALEYHDVTSLYPFVCSHRELPIGFPIQYFGQEARNQRPRLDKNHEDRLFGYIRCRVIPNKKCILGLLASHEDFKLRFDLEPKIGVWFIDEIYLAMQNGYC